MRPRLELLRTAQVRLAPSIPSRGDSVNSAFSRSPSILLQNQQFRQHIQHRQLPQQQWQQQRCASLLSGLSNKRAYNPKIRRGRGPSSGKGKTSGRGHGGQKARGKVPAGFEGGQTSGEKQAGSHGFVNKFPADLTPLNIDKIQEWIDARRLDPNRILTIPDLCRSGVLHRAPKGVKLLARNADLFTSKIDIVVSRASATAIAAIERLGGSVTTRYYTPMALKRIRQGEMDPIVSTKTDKEAAIVQKWVRQNGWDGDDAAVAALTAAAAVATTGSLSASSAPSSSSSTNSASPPTSNTARYAPDHPAPARLPTAFKNYKYALPDPAGRKDLEYYRDPAHRGYLAYMLKPDESPNLYVSGRAPILAKLGKSRAGQGSGQSQKGGSDSANRLW